MSEKRKRPKILKTDLFENESPAVMVKQSEEHTETEVKEEVDAIDALLDGNEAPFDKLEY